MPLLTLEPFTTVENSALGRVIDHIFFDLDHTLWHYDANSADALGKLFEVFDIAGLAEGRVDAVAFTQSFNVINKQVWASYNENRINRDELRDLRFRLVFEQLGINAAVPDGLAEAFTAECPKGSILIDGTLDVLAYLTGKGYSLHLLSNGFSDVMAEKVKSSDLNKWFKTSTSGECSGYKKPEPEIFRYAMAQANASADNSVMVGDAPTADVEGALKVGMRAIWFNAENEIYKGDIPPTYTITNLRELLGVL